MRNGGGLAIAVVGEAMIVDEGSTTEALLRAWRQAEREMDQLLADDPARLAAEARVGTAMEAYRSHVNDVSGHIHKPTRPPANE
jgi:hypothetical protein